MIDNHTIAYRNVVSKYYQFVPEEIELAFQDFEALLEKHQYHPTGTVFFSIMSDPTEEIMTAEIFFGIEEEQFALESEDYLRFRSYFSVKPMFMTRVEGDIQEQAQVKYWELIERLNQLGVEQATPVFVEYKRTHSDQSYIEMSVGYR
ncbi:DUF5085 family protein [Halalkalibacter sp. AB-rgal2]|uniref:DUF5085 domain-containing protein n=1 Tax=Halalkalibacter hemicellulosilyticusJCM 9152 TaxID=1236971 RepID=W4QJ08_9BACI|nr:DUF5085 family protein [Halalkalibacter hemicellulosilyticus]GAE32071.1 hypothetical protein JCM9152_3587 [Halalkalibacter hemicellulosilyticusJCM 9152]